jgi:anti-anti-sigma regulatory factor
MSLRIERTAEGETEIIRLIGRIEEQDLGTLQTEMRGSGPAICLDLRDVTLIDVHIVHYLIARRREGVRLRNIPAFIEEWMRREEEVGGGDGVAGS